MLTMQAGIVAALRAEGRAAAAALERRASAASSDRPGLSRDAVDPEQAAEMLESAQGMLRAQPDSHPAQCSRVEVSAAVHMHMLKLE